MSTLIIEDKEFMVDVYQIRNGKKVKLGVNIQSLVQNIRPTASASEIDAPSEKAVADYAVGKNVENKFTKRNIFEPLGIQVRNAYYEIGQPNLPEKNTYASIYFVDKRGLLHGVDNSLGHVVNRFTTRGYQETYLDVVKNPNIEGKEKVAYLKVGLSDTDVPYGIAPTVPNDWIGDYIATTAWVNKNSQTVSLKGSRATVGDWTIANLIPNKPVFIMGDNTQVSGNPSGYASIFVKSGATNSRFPCLLGSSGNLAEGYGSNVMIVVPEKTSIIVTVANILSINNKARLLAYQ